MKTRRIAIGIFLLAGAVYGQSRPFDIQVSFGGWSLSPFRSIVERECERLIKNEFSKLVESAIPNDLLTPLLSSVDLSSSGHFFSLAASYRFGEGRFSVGLRGDYFDFRVPYSLSVNESLEIWGFPLAALEGQGQGTVRLSGLAVSVLGRWTPLMTKRVDLSLQAGLMMLPFQGKILLDLTAALKTALGDLQFSGSFDDTFDEIRELGLDLPSVIFSPTFGIEFRYRFLPDAGFYLNATAAQGSFLSGGLFFSF